MVFSPFQHNQEMLSFCVSFQVQLVSVWSYLQPTYWNLHVYDFIFEGCDGGIHTASATPSLISVKLADPDVSIKSFICGYFF